jgi:hypothetical protein
MAARLEVRRETIRLSALGSIGGNILSPGVETVVPSSVDRDLRGGKVAVFGIAIVRGF